MPIYEYYCKKCDVVEIMQKISEGTKRKCPECGTLGLKRLLSAPSFQLKGTGWYVTDFRDGDKTKKDDKTADKKDDKSTDTKDSSTKDSSKDNKKSESKSDTKSKSDSKKGGKTKAA